MGLIRVFCFKSSSYSTLKVTIVDIDVGGTVMKIQTSRDLIYRLYEKRMHSLKFNHNICGNYFIFSSSLEHLSHTVSSSFDVNNLPHDEYFIICSSYITL